MLLERDDQIMTAVSSELLKAYRETHYVVFYHNKSMTLQVDVFSSALQNLQHQYAVTTSAFLTAFNPYSQICNAAKNLAANRYLESVLQKNAFPYLKGYGAYPVNTDWLPEESFLIMGVSLSYIRQLAQQFRQNAFLWSEEDAVPRLMFCREID